MSDMDEFKDTYFQECQELLSDLEEHFIAIEQNEHDGETLHAVFRAIHSIKGGAGAFGFETLVGFSHSFETFLDLLRDGKLHLSADIIALCLKANDIIADMVSAAQHEEDLGPDFGRDVEIEIKNASGLNGQDIGQIDEIETDISPAADQPQNASLDSDVMRAWKIEFKPYRALFERANEPLFLFRELSDIGTMRVHANVADVQDFMDFDPMEPCISWELYLETMAPRERISEVFEFVDLDCDLNISLVESDDAAPSSVPDEVDFRPENTPTGRAGTLDVDLSAFLDDDDDDFSVPVRKIVVEAAPQDPLLGEGLNAKSLFPSEPDKADGPQLVKSRADEPQPEELSAGLLARNYVENASALKPAPKPASKAPENTVSSNAIASMIGQGSGTPAAETAKPKLEMLGQETDQVKAPVQAIQSIRVDLDKVDRVVNMVGELVITQAMLTEQIDDPLREQYSELVRGLEILAQTTRELQDSVMAIRAQPVKTVFARMPRLVRELAMQTGKKMRLVMVGEATEIDKTVIEQLADPLTHMIRNSADHGLEDPATRLAAGKPEEGTIRLSADQMGGKIVIKIMDDGAGINREKVLEKAIQRGIVEDGAQLSDEEIDQLIFAPGFSTVDVVSNLSGRGVGMDVVRENIQRLGGRVGVKSKSGQGSCITLTLPLTLAVLDVMLVRVGEAPYVLPLASIIESIQYRDAKFGDLPNGLRVLRNRGEYIPVIELSKMFGFEQKVPPNEQFLIVCELDGHDKAAVLVDSILGQQQVVIKSLEENFERLDGISGATILGDGRVALILDVIGLKMVADVQKAGQAA